MCCVLRLERPQVPLIAGSVLESWIPDAERREERLILMAVVTADRRQMFDSGHLWTCLCKISRLNALHGWPRMVMNRVPRGMTGMSQPSVNRMFRQAFAGQRTLLEVYCKNW